MLSLGIQAMKIFMKKKKEGSKCTQRVHNDEFTLYNYIGNVLK